ncbi:MAG TPA: TrmH family RNA methyltransferase [Acidimicrobiia bacterium]|nr:TrmH family RNA methyltransferase [Acidimicrobiia bacterium]
MIVSAANPEIKAAWALRHRSERDATGRFLIEGAAEIDRAVEAGIEVETLYVLSGVELSQPDRFRRVVEIGELPYHKIAYGRDGLVAVAVTPGFGLNRLHLADPALVLVAEAIEKPGNLGAMLRSADGAGAAVVVADATVDLVNPNVVRASIGTLFTVPVAFVGSPEAIGFLKERGIGVAVATVEGGLEPWRIDLTPSVALVIGGEHGGLSDKWLEAADYRLTLPMRGKADSLNASVTAAVMLYEAVRQRSV